jgi:hypothetical protein
MPDLTQEEVAWDGSGDPSDTQKKGHAGTLQDQPGAAEGSEDLQPQPMTDQSGS